MAIYVNRRLTLSYQLFPLTDPLVNSNILALCVRHNTIHSDFFNLVNVYNRPGSRHAAIESLLRLAPMLPNLAIIQGDFNLHSPLWDPSYSHASGLGERLFYELSNIEMNLANDEGDFTWTNQRGSRSVIDLVFYHDLLARVLPQTLIDLEGRGRSDHAIIFLAFGKQSPHWGRPYIACDSEEEAAYLANLSQAFLEFCRLPPEVAGENLLLAAEDAWRKHSKLPRVDSNPNSWWTDDCQIAKDKYLLDHRFFASYSHHPPSLSMSSPLLPSAISSLSCVDNPQALSSLSSMAPDENWTTMQRKCNGRTGRTHIDQVHVCIYMPRHWGAIALAPIHAHFPILVGSHL